MSETIKISQLNAVEEINDNDVVPTVQNGITKKSKNRGIVRQRKKKS